MEDTLLDTLFQQLTFDYVFGISLNQECISKSKRYCGPFIDGMKMHQKWSQRV